MLKPLRKKLTLICVITTGILLSATAVFLLLLSEQQMERQSAVTFQNNLNSIVYKLQSSNIVDSTWLSQLEAGNRLLLSIADNGTPILYNGSWQPDTDRKELFQAVQKEALEQYGFDSTLKPFSVIDVTSITFDLSDPGQGRYQAAVALIPSAGGGWQRVTLLRDRSAELNQRFLMRLAFAVLIAAALILLSLFSWWFAGRAIDPIEQGHKRQVEFVAAASHELRSPLAVIQASLSALRLTLIQSDEPDSISQTQQRDKFLRTADRECRRMAGLIDDLLFLANTDAGSWSVRSETIEPDTLMLELLEGFETLARQKRQTLTLDLPEEPLPQLSGDRQRLLQALTALAGNAVSYTPEGGRIALRACLRGQTLLLSVEDNGPGVPDEQKGKIFERFYRADLSRSKKEHYGLGLSVAREIAQLHGGSLSVNDTPGGGASFTIALPVR